MFPMPLMANKAPRTALGLQPDGAQQLSRPGPLPSAGDTLADWTLAAQKLTDQLPCRRVSPGVRNKGLTPSPLPRSPQW